MSDGLASVEPDGALYQLGRQPDPWAWPDWSYAGPDGTFGNRYDDPEASYRVLYASSQRVGAFVETLARFRPDLEVLAELAQIEGDDGSQAVVLRVWPDTRLIGEATIQGRFVDVGDARTLATLRSELAASAIHFGLDEIDAGTIRLHAPRAFTQRSPASSMSNATSRDPSPASVTGPDWATSSSTGRSSNRRLTRPIPSCRVRRARSNRMIPTSALHSRSWGCRSSDLFLAGDREWC